MRKRRTKRTRRSIAPDDPFAHEPAGIRSRSERRDGAGIDEATRTISSSSARSRGKSANRAAIAWSVLAVETKRNRRTTKMRARTSSRLGPIACLTDTQRSAGSIDIRRTSRSEEHTSELQSPYDLVCRLLLEKK